MNKFFYLLLLGLLSSCSPKISTEIYSNYPPLNDAEEVYVIGLNEPEPRGNVKIGTVKIGDAGFTISCEWDIVIEKAKLEARRAGGNALKIIKHSPPDMKSTCHRIEAIIMVIDNLSIIELENSDLNVKSDSMTTKKTPTKEKTELPWSLGVTSGWSYRWARVGNDVPNALRDYVLDLKTGFHFGADFTYFFTDDFGLGFIYSRFATSNEATLSVTNPSTMFTEIISISDQIAIDYYAVNWRSRFVSENKKSQIYYDLALGYMHFRNQVSFIEDYTITSGLFGMSVALGFDYHINKNLTMGISTSLIRGSYDTYNLTQNGQTSRVTFDNDGRDDLSRLDISLALRYYL